MFYLIILFILLFVFIWLQYYFKKNIFNFLVIIILFFLLAELIFRLLEPYIILNIWIPCNKLGYRRRVNIPITNSFGFNDIERKKQRVANIKRIIVLGDSFNWSGGMGGNYINLLNKMLNTDTNIFEVFNMGFPAIGPGYLYKLLINEAFDYSPDIVMLSFFINNDFQKTKINLTTSALGAYIS